MKLLVILATVALLLWLIRGSRRKPDATPPRAPKKTAPRIAAPEQMVECAWCGLHLPASDALPAPGGQQYCCTDHRRRAGG